MLFALRVLYLKVRYNMLSVVRGERIVKLYRVRRGYIVITDLNGTLSAKTTTLAQPTYDQQLEAMKYVFDIERLGAYNEI